MSWANIKKASEIRDKYESPYLAVNCIAQKARRLKDAAHGVIFDSQAVNWALTGVPPENLDKDLSRKIQQEEGPTEEDRIHQCLDYVEEENIRTAVLNSYKLSCKTGQIAFDYNGIKDKGIRTRIRILTRMLFVP